MNRGEKEEGTGAYASDNDEQEDAVLVPSARDIGGDFEDEDIPLAELVRRRKNGSVPA